MTTSLYYPLIKINELEESVFENLFKNVIENHSKFPTILLKKRPFSKIDEVFDCVNIYLDHLDIEGQKSILLSHPDLNTKFTNKTELTSNSKEEQNSAGFDDLKEDEVNELCNLTKEYFSKHRFPFIICVKSKTIGFILKKLKERIINSNEEELKSGIEEVKKISKLRIQQIINI